MPASNSKASQDFKTQILLQFTKELIRNTDAYKVLIIKESEKLVELQKKQMKQQVQEIVKSKIKNNEKRLNQIKKRTFEIPQNVRPFKSFFEQRNQIRKTRPILQIPEPILPPTVQYIKPIPSQLEIDLKKLNPFVKDPFVKIIECDGPDENVMVIGTMGRKRTGTILSKEEIDEVIKIFSAATKIPIQEGVNKVVLGKMILSAIVSNIVGSRFIIKKMTGPPVVY